MTEHQIQLKQENPLYLQAGPLVRPTSKSFSSPVDMFPRKLSNFIQYLKFSNQLSRWMELNTKDTLYHIQNNDGFKQLTTGKKRQDDSS